MIAVMAARPFVAAPERSGAPRAGVSGSASGSASGADTASLEEARAAELARRALGGDRPALAELLRMHAQPIAALCHHVAGPSDARDAAQASFERIVRELPSFDGARGSFRSWSQTVARNVCRDRLRRRELERAAFAADGAPLTELAATGEADPERLAIARQGTSTLALTLEGLPEKMREALVMFHVGESSYEEIAVALDVPIGTVMTWLHRGRARLRAAIEEP